MAALQKMVSIGKLSPKAAEIALKVQGAWLGEKVKGADGKMIPDGLMLEAEDHAVANAFRRAGVEWTAEAAVRERGRSVDLRAEEKSRVRARASKAGADEARNLRNTEREQKAAERAAKPPGTVKPTSRPRAAKVKEPVTSNGLDEDGQMNVVARTAALRSEQRAHDNVASRATDGAPTPEFAAVVQAMRETPGYDAKQALYNSAKAGAVNKAQKEWVGRMLFPLTMFGQGGGEMRRQYAKANGHLFDTDIVPRKPSK
jgi:hypothetical protein